MWLSYYVKNIFLVFVLAFAITACVDLLLRLLPKKRPEPKSIDYIKKIVQPKPQNHIIERKKARKYLFFGLLMFGLSFLVRFNIYYIVSASVLFLLAFVSLFIVPYDNVSQDAV
jgi:drug/metabolite transporter (DMT)-like permease